MSKKQNNTGGEIRPWGHGERHDNRQFFKVFDLEELPSGKNVVTTAWTVPLWQRLRLLFGGKVWVTFKGKSHPPMRVDVVSNGNQ